MDNDASVNKEELKDHTGKSQTDNAGQPVTDIDQVLRYDYNLKGERTSLLRDNNVDGKYDYREAYTLDVNGFTTATEEDLTNDGKIDRVTKNTLNAKGEVRVSEYYTQAVDGTQTYTGKDVYKLDSNGNRTEKSSYSAQDSLSFIETYELNGKGQVVKKLVDNYGDGTINRAEIYTLDSHGRIAKNEVDSGNDGIINSQTVSIYDALGRATKVSVDRDNDGVFERITDYQYDTYGNIYSSLVFDKDGKKVSETVVYSFDAYGRRLEHYTDRLGDGPTRDDVFYKTSYDDLNNLSRTDYYRGDSKLWYGADIELEKDSYGRLTKVGSPKAEDSQEVVSYYAIAFENPVYINAETQMKNFTGTQLNWTADLIISDTGLNLKTFIDNTGEKDGSQYEQLVYGNRQNNYARDLIDDFTTWSTEESSRLKGLNMITLSKSDASTTIVLDNAVIGKISPTGRVSGKSGTLTINGDATDTVNLKGADFTKLSETHTSGANTFNMYSTEVDGKTYTLYIDNDIQTVIG